MSKTEMRKAIDDILTKGHDLAVAHRGEQTGHACRKCKKFKSKNKFAAWRNLDCQRVANASARTAAHQQAKKVAQDRCKEIDIAKMNFEIPESKTGRTLEKIEKDELATRGSDSEDAASANED